MPNLNSLRTRVVLLWLVFLLVLAFGLLHGRSVRETIIDEEFERFERESVVASVASEVFTAQLVHQVEALLRAVRQYHRKSGAFEETEAFIDQLGFDRTLIDNLYLLDAKGWGIAKARGHNAFDREYFQHHLHTPGNDLLISPVDFGLVTGKLHFRISLRVEREGGAFDGVVLATVKPEAFSNFYRQLADNENRLFSLISTEDHRLRARLPEPAAEQWLKPLSLAEWPMIKQEGVGSFRTVSPVDEIERILVFRKLERLPLVIIVGFTEADVMKAVDLRFSSWQTLALSGLLVLAMTALMLTLTLVSRERLANANGRLSEAYDTMRTQAMTDALTGLPARPMFFDRLAQALSAARRNERLVGLLFLDLDGFKAVNDTWGHDSGDLLLKAVAQRWLACVRESDTVARLGGDEFAVIIGDLESETSLAPVCEKLIMALAEHFELPEGGRARVGVSIGVAVYPENGLEIDSLLGAADAAMYRSKARGKNTYTYAQTRPVRNGEALEWLVFSESHVVGVAEIDEQHRHLVRLVNRLNRAVTGGHDPAQIAGLFVTLNAATREHFATEHHYMQRHDYPAMTAHELEHKRLLDDLAQIAVGAGPGRELLILQTLKDWLLEHIQNSDRLLGQYLVRHGCR